MQTKNSEAKIHFEAHLRAIEDAVNNASLEGGCDFSDHVIYHCEKIRALYEDGMVERMVEFSQEPYLGDKI